jgi:hypothetical protein
MSDRPDDGTEDFDERCTGTDSCTCAQCMRDFDADGDEDVDDEDDECFHCCGEGYDECPHPMECTRRHTAAGLCPCGSCGGSGRAKDMTIW